MLTMWNKKKSKAETLAWKTWWTDVSEHTILYFCFVSYWHFSKKNSYSFAHFSYIFWVKRRQAWKLLGTVQLDLIQQVTRHLNMSFLVSTREQFKKINQWFLFQRGHKWSFEQADKAVSR